VPGGDGMRFKYMKFQVLTAANLKMTALSNIALCCFVEVDRRFRGAYSLHCLMMEAVRTIDTAALIECSDHCCRFEFLFQ
jgi:hypothetical protein